MRGCGGNGARRMAEVTQDRLQHGQVRGLCTLGRATDEHRVDRVP